MKILSNDMYLLLIDEEAEINKGDYFLLSNTKINICGHEKRVSSSHSPKILAYLPLTKEAKELDLPLLPNPSEEQIDLHKLYNEKIKSYPFSYRNSDSYFGFGLGYKTAQAKQFSLEDMRKAIEMARKCDYGYDVRKDETYCDFHKTDDEIIQSLSTQQLPKEFVISDKFSTFEENIKNGKYKW